MQSFEQRQQSKSDHAGQAPGFWTLFRRPLFFGVGLLIELTLWGAGYPPWRLAAIAALFAALICLPDPAAAGLSDSVAGTAGFGRRERPRTISRWGLVQSLTIGILVVALTGGLHSPMVAAIIAVATVVAVQNGWSRVTWVACSLTVAATVAMASLPQAWFGPGLPPAAFAFLAATTVVASAALGIGHIITLMDDLETNRFALNHAREQLIAQMDMRARELEQMSAQLSHELKNPLQAIGILVQLSARDACDPEARERLQVAQGEVERMDSIIKEYLSFSRPFDKLQPKRVALGAMADEVIAVLEGAAAAAGVQLRRRGEAYAEADPRRLRGALHNLISNGLEACSRGGRVEVEISEREGGARIVVRDSGRGMSREVLQRLGTAFFTTRPEGTGLGVAMARAAFTQHGGELVYESEEGRGTTATGTLPLRQQERSEHGARAFG